MPARWSRWTRGCPTHSSPRRWRQAGVARFPDAPTARGTRHLHELIAATTNGNQAAVVFVTQRPDAQHFAPHDAADEAFGATLREAAQAGVGVYAWTCSVNQQAIKIAKSIPVVLE